MESRRFWIVLAIVFLLGRLSVILPNTISPPSEFDVPIAPAPAPTTTTTHTTTTTITTTTTYAGLKLTPTGSPTPSSPTSPGPTSSPTVKLLVDGVDMDLPLRPIKSFPPGRATNITGNFTPIDVTWFMAVAPNYNAMFCTVYKSASSLLSSLYIRMMGDPDYNQMYLSNMTRSEAGCAWYTRWREYWPYSNKCSGLPPMLLNLHMIKAPEKEVENRRWRKIIIVRDPLDRLLSGFLDKCVNAHFFRHQRTPHCPINVTTFRTKAGEPVSVPQEVLDAGAKGVRIPDVRDSSLLELFDAVIDVVAEKRRTEGPAAWTRTDLHFVPQARCCGTLKGIAYDWVGVYSENLLPTVLDMLDFLEMPHELVTSGWGLHRNASIVRQTIHATRGQTTTSERIRTSYTPARARRVMAIYAIDYHHFPQLLATMPSWALDGQEPRQFVQQALFF